MPRVRFKKPFKPKSYGKVGRQFVKDTIKDIKQSFKNAGIKNPGKMAKEAYNKGKVQGKFRHKLDEKNLNESINKAKTVSSDAKNKSLNAAEENLKQHSKFKQYRNQEKLKEKYGPEARKERNKNLLIGSAIAAAPLVADELTEENVPAVVFKEEKEK